MSNTRLKFSFASGRSSLTATSNRLGRNDSRFGSAAARLNMPPPCTQRRRSAPALRRDVADEKPVDDYVWDGTDEFEGLEDRRDLPPVALPPITGFREVVLIRHGQSTWNKAKRIQGSSNVSVLSEEGVRQAEVARDKVKTVLSASANCASRSLTSCQFKNNGRMLPSLRRTRIHRICTCKYFISRVPCSLQGKNMMPRTAVRCSGQPGPLRSSGVVVAALLWSCLA